MAAVVTWVMRRRRSQTILASILALALFPATASAEGPRRVVALLAHDGYEVHSRALAGFVEAFPTKLDLNAFDVESQSSAAGLAIKDNSPDLILALGPAALAKARELAPGVMRVFALSEPQDCTLSPRNGETGVVLRIDGARIVDALLLATQKVHRVGFISAANPSTCNGLELRRALSARGLEAEQRAVSDARGGLQALREMRGSVDALVLLPEPRITTDETIQYAILAGLDRRIPVVGFSARIAASGALLAVSLDPYAIGAQAAELAQRMTSTGPLPAPELPRTGALSINVKTARRIGIELSSELRAGAREQFGEP